ncbi:MAG: hypothetical protein AAF822_05695 [Pseudomonadota bacterium]
MTQTLSQMSPRARLFEFLRQEDLADRTAAPITRKTPADIVSTDSLAAFQKVALQSLDRSAR